MPDAYDAGTIRAHADLNRDPFIEGLQACRQQGRAFAQERFTATADVNDVNARRQLAQLQILMRRISEETVDVQVDTDGVAAAIGELEALRREQERVAQSTVTSSRTAVAAHREETKQLGLLRTAIEMLGPPLVPLAGAAVAASTAFVGLGIAGVAAMKGIQNEYKTGTPLGQKYAGMLANLKTQADTLGHTAAKGVLEGLNAAVTVANRQLPLFNMNLASSARQLGTIAQHAIGGLVGGFNTFYPLILRMERVVGDLVVRFEDWATGPGGRDFMATITQDFDHALPAVEAIAVAVAHLVAAFHPVGLGMLDLLTGVARAIDTIPVDVLQAAATAYIAFRSAVIVTRGLEAASAMLYKLSGAELAAARSATVLGAAQARAGMAGAGAAGFGAATYSRGAASLSTFERTAGFLAVATRNLVPFAIGWTVATVGISAAADATEKWRQSSNEANLVLADTVKTARDLFTFNWSSLANDFRAFASGGAAITTLRRTQALISASTSPGAPGFGQAGIDPRFQPSLRAGVEQLGSDVPGFSVGVESLASARRELAGYAAAMTEARTRGAELNREQSALAAAGMQGSVAWRENAAAIRLNNLAGLEASHNYDTLRGNIQAYVSSLNSQIAAQNRVRDAYARQQGAQFGAAQRSTFAQAGTDLTSGAAGLAAYASSLQRAIRSESQWTRVTDDNTVSIRGHVFEQKSWDAAMTATNQNVDRSIGLLLGHRAALANDKAALQGAVDMQARLNEAVGRAELKYKLTDDQLNMYAASVGLTAEKVATGAVSTHQFVTAIGRAVSAIRNGSTATTGWITALTTFTAGEDNAATRAQLLSAAFVSLQGDTLGWQSAISHSAVATKGFVQAFKQADKGVVDAKKGLIEYRKAGAAPLLDALSAMQTQAAATSATVYQHVRSISSAKDAAHAAANVFRNDTTDALVKERGALGLTRGEAEKLAQRYFHWPKKATTQAELLGSDTVTGLLRGIENQLEILTGTRRVVTVDADTSAASAAISALRYNASQQIVVPVSGTKAEARGGIVYAARGEIHEPMIVRVRPGTVRVWAEPETGGEAYIPLANDHRRPRARAIARQTVRQLGGDVVGFATGGNTGGGSGGLTQSQRQAAAAAAQQKRQAAAAAAAQTRHDIETLLREMMRDRLGQASLEQLDRAASTSVLAYANNLLDQARRAVQLHITTRDDTVVGLRKSNQELAHELSVRDRLANRHDAIEKRIAGIRQRMDQEQSTVAGAITGGFDIGTSGQGYRAGIRSSLEDQLRDAQRFARLRRQARELGLDPRLLRQITREGPETAGANLAAIVSGGRRYVRGINQDYTQLSDLANKVGGTQAREIYGHRLEQAQHELHRVAAQQRDATRAVNGTLRDIRRDLTRLTNQVADDRRRNGGHR
jgi:hypothetical protein